MIMSHDSFFVFVSPFEFLCASREGRRPFRNNRGEPLEQRRNAATRSDRRRRDRVCGWLRICFCIACAACTRAGLALVVLDGKDFWVHCERAAARGRRPVTAPAASPRRRAADLRFHCAAWFCT